MKIDTEKIGIKTFVIEYEDGSKDIVKPVSWKYLDDVQILQYQILEVSAQCGGSPGDLFNPTNKDFWEPAKKMASLMPIVGKEEKGFDIDKIEDCETLIDIFITTTKERDPETGFIIPGNEGVLLPSLISRINGINFLRLLAKIQQNLIAQMESQ